MSGTRAGVPNSNHQLFQQPSSCGTSLVRDNTVTAVAARTDAVRGISWQRPRAKKARDHTATQHIPTHPNTWKSGTKISWQKKSAVSLPELRTSLPIRRRTPPFSAESAPPHGDISTAWQNPCKAIPCDSNLLIGLFVAMDYQRTLPV